MYMTRDKIIKLLQQHVFPNPSTNIVCDVEGFEDAADALLKMLGAPVAWSYELANARRWEGGKPAEYCDWRPRVSVDKPCVPSGSIRNLRPLYAGEPETV